MTYEFDMKVYCKNVLLCLGLTHVIVLILTGTMSIIKPSYMNVLEYAWPFIIICFGAITIGGLVQCCWQRKYIEENHVRFETNNGQDEVIVVLRTNVIDAKYRVREINRLRRNCVGEIYIRGMIENARMPVGNGDTRKRLMIPPYFKDMDGLFKDLERYQRQMQEREWEEAHETRI